MYLKVNWVSLGILAFCCVTRGQKSSLDEDGKLITKLGLINERIQNLEASVGELNKRPVAGLTTSLDTGTRTLHHPLHGPYKTG